MKAILRMGAACLVLCVATRAGADAPGDAWAAAKPNLPASPTSIVGMNVATLKASLLFQQLFPQLLAQAGSTQEGLDKIKVGCGIDVMTVVQGVVVAMDDTEKGGLFISTKGVPQAKATECVSKLAAKETPPKKVSASKADAQGIVEFTEEGETKHFYVAFLPKGVMVLSTAFDDKAALQKVLAGKGATAGTPMARAIGAVNTGAPLWIASVQDKSLAPQVNATVKLVYGQADLTGGNVNADFHVVTNSVKEATDLTAFAKQQLESVKGSGSLPPQAITLMQAVKMSSANDELLLKASVPEKDALTFISAAMQH